MDHNPIFKNSFFKAKYQIFSFKRLLRKSRGTLVPPTIKKIIDTKKASPFQSSNNHSRAPHFHFPDVITLPPDVNKTKQEMTLPNFLHISYSPKPPSLF